MSSRILLISTNRCASPDPVFPLGLAYVNAALRRAGHEVEWFDYQVDSGVEGVISRFRPDFIGVSLRNIDDVLIRRKETFFPDVVSLCEGIRKVTGAPIILGGSGFSIFPERLLELTGADYGIGGEGEEAFVQLVEALEKKQPVPKLFRGSVGSKPPPDLDLPDRPQRIVDYYVRTSGMLNLQTQRGCSFGCCYCTYPVIEGRHHRRRSPESVAGEFELLARSGARYAFIVDSVFNSSNAHIAGICEALIRRENKLQWGCFLRPQHLTADLLKLMRRAGLAHIEFGTDSFCDEVLAAYGKGFTFDDILQSSDLAREQEIDFCHFLISGGAGETEETLAVGFENSQRVKGGVVMVVTGMRIYPGTALHARALREGVVGPETDLLAPVYYVARGLEPEKIYESLNEFARRAPNWIVGDPSPEYQKLVNRLRERRVVGPLWSYFSMLQRLWPQPALS
jgi:radical SAM superfamily enzyme YgiQ (UPF0313 family)